MLVEGRITLEVSLRGRTDLTDAGAFQDERIG
jgi:hypothetical protein